MRNRSPDSVKHFVIVMHSYHFVASCESFEDVTPNQTRVSESGTHWQLQPSLSPFHCGHILAGGIPSMMLFLYIRHFMFNFQGQFAVSPAVTS